MKIDSILLKPVMTEKATNFAKGKVYMFEVANKANKFQVKDALENLYAVKVSQVRIIKRKGKVRKVGKYMTKKKLSDKKIAVIKISEGKIDLFPQT